MKFSIFSLSLLFLVSSCCFLKYTQDCHSTNLKKDLFSEDGKYRFISPTGKKMRFWTITELVFQNESESGSSDKNNVNSFNECLCDENITAECIAYCDLKVLHNITEIPDDESKQNVIFDSTAPRCPIGGVWKKDIFKFVNESLSRKVASATLTSPSGNQISGIREGHLITFPKLTNNLEVGRFSLEIKSEIRYGGETLEENIVRSVNLN